eukprot:TRINITY_DN465_c0_g1_i1.p1 TRINITY_DN465_c0_g1~~TRINITY_DN465_c0_g1_i1.p1  ORF type:complete len:401 (-),score=97.43 TRINITY_DN465_c0_g1_i1:76-1278(-)
MSSEVTPGGPSAEPTPYGDAMATPAGPAPAAPAPAPAPAPATAPIIVCDTAAAGAPAAEPATTARRSTKEALTALIGDIEAQAGAAFGSLDLPMAAELVSRAQRSARFRRHAGCAVAFAGVSLVLWVALGFFVGWYPWWIYSTALSAAALAVHFCLFTEPGRRDWLQLHVAMFAITNLTCLLAWQAAHSRSLWFAYVLVGTGYFLVVHLICVRMREAPHITLKLHALTTVAAILECICAYVDEYDRVFVWPIVPAYVLGLMLAIHAYYEFKPDRFTAHCLLFAVSQVFCVSMWLSFSSYVFPWFVLVFLLWSGLLVFHYVKFVRAPSASTVQPAPAVPKPKLQPQLQLPLYGDPAQFAAYVPQPGMVPYPMSMPMMVPATFQQQLYPGMPQQPLSQPLTQ